jgi:glycosyltransferase involved in cell wall biosynthesis
MCTHIVPSQYFKGVVSGKLGIDNSNIVVSPSGGVDTNAFMCEQRVHKDSIVIGFSSGMTKRKGSNIVMSLIDRSEDIENSVKHKVFFNIIDYGDDMHLYKDKLIRRSNVSLIPRMPKEKMPSFYNGIDILLIGSNSSESLGLVVLEAMSCGKPVITFKLFAFPEFVIPGVSGELVDYCPNEKENVSQFMDAIEKVANSYGDYNPRKIVTERYSSEHVVEQYKELFTN